MSSEDLHSLPVLPVESPDGGKVAASTRRRGSLEAYEAAPDQQFVSKIRRHDSLNEFRMQHGAKPAVTVVSSVPPSIPEATETKKSGPRKPASRGDAAAKSPFAAAFGNASSSSQFTSKIKRGDTLKQFKTPASIQSIFGSVSDEAIDEDAPEEPAPARSAPAKKTKGQSSPFSSLLSGSGVSPSQQFATKITSRDTLKQFKPPAALSAALFTAPSSALSSFDQSSIEETEEDHFASPVRRESGGKRGKPSPSAGASAVSPATAFKQQLSELPDQQFSQKIQASDTLKVFKKQPSLTDTNLFDPPSASLYTQSGSDKSIKKGRALPGLTEETRAPVFNTALTQLPDQKFTSKIKRNDTLRAYKQPPAINSSFFAPPPTDVTEVEEEEEEEEEEDDDENDAELLRNSAAALSESKAELEKMRAQMQQLLSQQIDEDDEEEEEEEEEEAEPPRKNGKVQKVTERPNKVPSRPPVAGRQVSTVVEEADASDDDATQQFLNAMRAQLGAVPADISPGKPDLGKKKSIGVLPDVAFARRITRNDSLVQFDLASKKKDADVPPPKPFAAWSAPSQPPSFTPAAPKPSAADLAAARAVLDAAASQFTPVTVSQLSAPANEVRRRSDIGVRSKGSRSPNRQRAQQQQRQQQQQPAKPQQSADASLQSAYAQFTAFTSALSDSDEDSAPAPKFSTLAAQAPPAAASKLRASSVMPSSAKPPAPAPAPVASLSAKPAAKTEVKAPAHEAQKLAALKRAKTVNVEHRRTQSAVSERNLLGELFKAINTMNASGVISPAQKGTLKDLVIRQDKRVMEAALAFAQDNSFENLSAKLHALVDTGDQPNPFVAQYVGEAKQIFDGVDSDKDGSITKEQVHIALVSTGLPLTPEQLKGLSSLPPSIDFAEFVKLCVRASLDLTSVASR